MTYRIFSPSHPAGVVNSGQPWLTPDILECVADDGVARVSCPCCDKRIVVRYEADSMNDADRTWLEGGGGAT